jgi:hypothetical protein
MRVLTLELADQVDAKVEARFTTDEPRKAKLYVDGEHIGTEKTRRSFPAGSVLPTHNVGDDLGKAIDGGAGVSQLSLTSEQADRYRRFRNAAEDTKECIMDGCHKPAHMLASAGPACRAHYDDLS